MPNYKRVFIPNSYIFLTIITNNRLPILIKNINLLREAFEKSKITYTYQIIASVVLPEHIHLILKPENIAEYPKIISSIKHHFSKNINIKVNNLSKSKVKKREKGIWHRRFFEHTIRDKKDLNNHINYIHYNPVKHNLVKNVIEWEYSSFHNFVKEGLYEKNWGSDNEKTGFINLYND